jgi:hypothetical protein
MLAIMIGVVDWMNIVWRSLPPPKIKGSITVLVPVFSLTHEIGPPMLKSTGFGPSIIYLYLKVKMVI